MRDFTFLKDHFRLSQPLEHVFITQPFGANDVPFYAEMGLKGHNATDYRASTGTFTFAAIDGTVVVAGQDINGGREVRIQTDEKTVNGVRYKLELIYYHLDTWEVIAGERVYRGQKVGTTGNTGKYTTAPHLHFGIKIMWWDNGWQKDYSNGYGGAQDPQPFMTYMAAEIHNPYGIPENTLIQLTENKGGFALYSEGRFFVDDLDKILASWAVRNKGETAGKTLAVAQVVYDAYPKFNLKHQPL